MKNVLIIFLLMSMRLTAQELKPTEKEALVNVTVTDFKSNPRPGEIIVFESKKTKKEFQMTADAKGTGSVLVPKGDTYIVKYKTFLSQKEYSSFAIPDKPGLFTSTVKIQLDEEEKTYTLDNVFFDTGKSTLRPESFPALKELLEVMKGKTTLVIEIAGHTDNVGSPEANMKLSQGRAEAVRAYLLKNGIAPGRVTAKGYGDTEPVADNNSDEGKQKNRRTEVRIMAE